jgi:Ca2+-binding EF-hand superfamily protein
MPAAVIRTRRLARAGWSIVSPQSPSPEPQENLPLNEELNILGAQLVSEIAASWTRKYKFTIMRLGYDGQSAFHYECIFSLPTNEVPVPSFVLSTRFALAIPGPGADPRLFYSFEEGDLRHEWAVHRDVHGKLRPSSGQQLNSLGDACFEKYIDRLLYEKEKVRICGVNLQTSFEQTRLEKPPAYSEASSEDDADSEGAIENDREDVPTIVIAEGGGAEKSPRGKPQDQAMMTVMREALQAAGLYCDKVEPPSSLADLLASIFDAADEENVGELPHYEVARLLSATLPGFGLEMWDIHLLLTSAQENDDGFIECKPFIQAAPEIIHALRKRRMAYRNRGLPGIEVPQEAVKHCFTDEVTVTASLLSKIIEQCVQEEPGCGKMSNKHPKEEHHQMTRGRAPRGSVTESTEIKGARTSLIREAEEQLVGIKRRFCQDCITSLPEQLSPQEMMRLMQMLPEDEDGYVMTDELIEILEHLRMDAMLNALVESDVLSLRTQLVLGFRRLGLDEDGTLLLWNIKEALLQADQICLNRLQIHTLLSLASPDSSGNVNIAEFLGMCCVIIPHMFDAKRFVETAEHLILEHAESMRRAENEELAALGAARVGQAGQEGEEHHEKTEVDPETVEKTLMQILTLNDDAHRTPPALPPETIYNILGINEKEVQAIQLTTFELNGFVAEMQTDADGFVPYGEHVKKWVPIIFEQRKNQLLVRYLQPDSYETLGIQPPNLKQLEAIFPLLPADATHGKSKTSQRRSSRIRRDSYGVAGHSMASNVPTHSRDTKLLSGDKNSKGSPHHTRRGSMAEIVRRPSKVALSGLGGRRPSRAAVHLLPETKEKEPPLGRGFQRRKNRMLAMAAEEAHLNGAAINAH